MANRKKIDDELRLASESVKTATDNFNNMSYDNFKQGSMYQGIQKDYAQQGQQAMKDTLGQVAARTGGMASSYATSAANQSYNNYMRQLEDVARAMYNDEYSRARDNVSLAQNEYNRLYGESRDAIADQRYEDEWAYQLDKDAKAVKDAELQALLGSEDFDWDNHDWDGDGMIGAADTNGEGSPADFFEGSTYGVDVWKSYAKDAENARINDEKKNGTLINSLTNSASHTLGEKEQKDFDRIYGDGAYQAVQVFLRNMSAENNETAIGNPRQYRDPKVFEEHFNYLIDRLAGKVPMLSEDQIFALIQKVNPDALNAVAIFSDPRFYG